MQENGRPKCPGAEQEIKKRQKQKIMMYIDFPGKRKKEKVYATRVSLFFQCLKLKNRKKIPFVRKKETVCPEEAGARPDGNFYCRGGIYEKLDLKKWHVKRKLAQLRSMML